MKKYKLRALRGWQGQHIIGVSISSAIGCGKPPVTALYVARVQCVACGCESGQENLLLGTVDEHSLLQGLEGLVHRLTSRLAEDQLGFQAPVQGHIPG
jgi:hypothetical protein